MTPAARGQRPVHQDSPAKLFSALSPDEKDPQHQLVGEQEVDRSKKHVYSENYGVDKEIHESVKKVIQEMKEKQFHEIDKRAAYINVNTGDLVEKYRDSK